MPPKTLGVILEMEGKHISSGKFLQAVRSFFGFLNDVADDVAGKEKSLKWVVSVDPGSLRIACKPEPGTADESVIKPALVAVADGLIMIEEHDKRPAHFGDGALNHIRHLGRLIGDTDGDIEQIRVFVEEKPRQVSSSTVANVDKILGPLTRADGSVEGRLSVISDRKDLQIFVDDDITDRSIRCKVDREKLGDLLANFGRRVIVSGLVRYRRDGEPTSIDVESFRILGHTEELPSFDDVKGILREDE